MLSILVALLVFASTICAVFALRTPTVLLGAIPRMPWWAQRLAIAGVAPLVMAVSGRQVGKTELGAHWILKDWPADSRGQGLLLTPTYRIGLTSSRRMRELASRLGASWNQTDGCLIMPGGQIIWVRSCDRPDAARGIEQLERLWIDEVTLISSQAWEAVQGCMVSAKDPRVLLTGTPKGKGHWAYRLWTDDEEPPIKIAMRSGDSPISNKKVIARLRRQMSSTIAAQELDAKWVDQELIPFPPEAVERLFHALTPRGNAWTIGIDLAKVRHWTVVTAMNELGEAWVIGRWRHVAWPDTNERLKGLVARYEASVIWIDEGHGGGYGGVMADFLAREFGEARVERVRTGNPGTKSEIIEALSADIEYERIRVDRVGGHADQLREELLQVVGDRRLTAGVERIIYPGPIDEDDFDDCVISLALANWGRLQAIESPGGGVWETITVTERPPPEKVTARTLFAGLALRPGRESALVVVSHELEAGFLVVERFHRGQITASVLKGLLKDVAWLALEDAPRPRPPAAGWPVPVLVVVQDLAIGAERVGRLLQARDAAGPPLACRDDRAALALRSWRWTDAGKPDPQAALPAALCVAISARLDELSTRPPTSVVPLW